MKFLKLYKKIVIIIILLSFLNVSRVSAHFYYNIDTKNYYSNHINSLYNNYIDNKISYNYLFNILESIEQHTDICIDILDQYYIKAYDFQKRIENPNLIEYHGPIRHVFFHSLIVYPQLAFDGDRMSLGYNKWMTTVKEFKLMLNNFYKKDYVLIDINLLIDEYEENGKKLIKKPIKLMLPEGKKPLIISIDDVNYLSYTENDGFADKLVLDENGDVATLVKNLEGKKVITRDGDVVPILDDFIKAHPDFSFNGAKGIIAVTGYEGLLGYPTQKLDSKEYAKNVIAVKRVVKKLKDTGWLFASHSYTHDEGFLYDTISLDFLKYDSQKWKKEVGSLLGKVNIFIPPFGARFKNEDSRYRFLIEKMGFNIYCPVYAKEYSKYYFDNFVMDRINLDGYTMYYHKYYTTPFFNSDDIIDSRRPPLPPLKK